MEDEPNKEPRTIVDASSRWDSRETGDDDGCADIADPRFGISALIEVERQWHEGSDYYAVEMGVVDGAYTELTCWANETPRMVVSKGRFVKIQERELTK